MTQRTQAQPSKATTEPSRAVAPDQARDYVDVATLLERMTPEERVRAYRTRSITRRELSIAAAREPERMPTCNGEFEWIALSLADLD